jgi:hypothetical protein
VRSNKSKSNSNRDIRSLRMTKSSNHGEIRSRIRRRISRYVWRSLVSDKLSAQSVIHFEIALAHVVECSVPTAAGEALRDDTELRTSGIETQERFYFDDLAKSQ